MLDNRKTRCSSTQRIRFTQSVQTRFRKRELCPYPDYQSVMLPLLRVAADGKIHTVRDAIDTLANQFGLSEQERKELLPSGTDRVFDNRIG
jgi:hypothetical protein